MNLSRRWSYGVGGLGLVLLALLLIAPWDTPRSAAVTLEVPTYGDPFWNQWGDGNAELAGYALTYPRYGEQRQGSAVTIFVTETFANDVRVKHERRRRSADELFPVMKLNLIQDFPTGIYDYNLMTSVFVGLEAVNGRPAGSPTKISFSSQEWCGHVYSQLLFDAQRVRHESHSYFDGEADQRQELDYPGTGVAEDALMIWARGFAGPVVPQGESRKVKLLLSLEQSRLAHHELGWAPATLSRSSTTTEIDVPAGRFVVERLDVKPERGTRESAALGWSFWVEQAEPRRLVRWTRSDGVEAELLASDRLQYWGMNADGFREALNKLGLEPRGRLNP